MSDTIAAVATGAQVCAIGILRLSGPEAVSIVERLFTPADGLPLSAHDCKNLVYGTLRDAEGRILDLCLCTFSRAPRSYTGEDTAELQCHGSPVVLTAALEACFVCGARQAGPGEFTRRAFLNGVLALTEAEAVADLIHAESLEAAHNAAGQLSGALSGRIDEVYRSLEGISAHYHAVLDYPDEDVEDFRLQDYCETLNQAKQTLRRLLDSYGRGRLMNAGLPVAIVGRPNAGKSSLLNALLGYDRAIVTANPGTTRDTIEERLRLGALTLRLTDTAGLREADDEAERLGVERSRRAMEQAELVLAVIDGSAALDAEDEALLLEVEKAPHAIVILSKNDLPQRVKKLDTPLPQLTLSAATGEGLDALQREIEALFPLPVVPAGEILTNARQAEAIRRALASLDSAARAMHEGQTPDIVLTETEQAMQALGELSGRSVREDVTQEIFSRFCVGK
ncbi:MAG: tRNA uridine-5-carboxymethylaminomethyl(34) synthesis GTPase MnmE [Oscillospiraceae bacterium]|nr:tRNA uridine-5-carboxymethylaminomethyl(34) synthesis GTPase MnmE [Oscillospiraceae bacterium]